MNIDNQLLQVLLYFLKIYLGFTNTEILYYFNLFLNIDCDFLDLIINNNLDIDLELLLLSNIPLTNRRSNKRTKLTKEEKSNVKLTDTQRDILVGSMLGDASMEKQSATGDARLRFDQTFPGHASYIMWLFSHFYNFTGAGPLVSIRKPDLRTGNIYASISFKTLIFPCLTFYYNLFYFNNIKIVPLNIEDYLTPLALAVWICDDGGKSLHNETILHTRSYTYEEVLLLQSALKNKFNLITRNYEKAPNQWVIIIPLNQETSLKEIVLPYIHYSFLYKI